MRKASENFRILAAVLFPVSIWQRFQFMERVPFMKIKLMEWNRQNKGGAL